MGVTQTQPLDPLHMIEERLNQISTDIRPLPGLLARVEAQVEATSRLEISLKDSNAEFRKRDDEKQKAIQDVQVRIAEIIASIAVLSSALNDTKANVPRRMDEISNRVEKVETELDELRPWVHGVRWAAMIIGGALLLALFGGLLWAFVQSGGGVP